MNIAITGYTDKRPLIYPILKLLQHTGDILLVSNDRRFLRLSGTNDFLGHFQNIMLYVTDAAPDEVWVNIEQMPEDFTHIIYDLKAYLPDNKIDLSYVVETSAYEEGEEDFVSLIDDAKHIKLCYDGKRSSDKDTVNIPISMSIISYCEQVEALKILPEVPSSAVINLLSEDFSQPLKLDKRSIKKILKGGWKV